MQCEHYEREITGPGATQSRAFETWCRLHNCVTGSEACLRARTTDLERMLKDYRDAWPKLRLEFMNIRALARQEQARPTELHMTCLSLIEKAADRALNHVPDHRIEAANGN